MLRSRVLALLLGSMVLAALPARADEPPPTSPSAPTSSPKKAWEALEAEWKDQVKRKAGLREQRAAEFLRAWSEAKSVAKGEELVYLGRFLDVAGRPVESAVAYCEAAEDDALGEGLRDSARTGLAAALVDQAEDDLLQGEALTKALGEVEGMLGDMTGEGRNTARSQMHSSLGQVCLVAGRPDAALEHFVQAASENPGMAYSMSHQVVFGLIGTGHSLADYDGIRERGRKALDILVEIQQKNVETAKAKGDAHAVQSTEMFLKRIQEADQPLQMLGRPAAEWTLEHAFGKGRSLADYRGKVVVLDFWATWCPWCIKSFPAIRDVLRDYAGKDLTFVGVTATATPVYESRYDLDEDMAEKAKGADARAPLQRPRATPAAPTLAADAGKRVTDGLAKAEDAKTKLKDAVAKVKEILDAMEEGAQDPEDSRKRLEAARKGFMEADARLEEAMIDLRRAAPAAAAPIAPSTEALEQFRKQEQEAITKFIANHEMSWDVVMIDEKEPSAKYALGGWPHALVLDKEGRVRYVKSGALLRDKPAAVAKFRAVLDGLLAE